MVGGQFSSSFGGMDRNTVFLFPASILRPHVGSSRAAGCSPYTEVSSSGLSSLAIWHFSPFGLLSPSCLGLTGTPPNPSPFSVLGGPDSSGSAFADYSFGALDGGCALSLFLPSHFSPALLSSTTTQVCSSIGYFLEKCNSVGIHGPWSPDSPISGCDTSSTKEVASFCSLLWVSVQFLGTILLVLLHH